MTQEPERAYTDPPEMPRDERMRAAELRMVREFLGLPERWLAAHLGVKERTLRQWEDGDRLIPDGVREEIEHLEQQTAQHVTAAVEKLLDAREPTLLTYRTDADYEASEPGVGWPASWHRAVVARVAQEVPGLAVDYWTPHGPASQLGDRKARIHSGLEEPSSHGLRGYTEGCRCEVCTNAWAEYMRERRHQARGAR